MSERLDLHAYTDGALTHEKMDAVENRMTK